MERKRYSVEKIVATVWQHELGTPEAWILRRAVGSPTAGHQQASRNKRQRQEISGAIWHLDSDPGASLR